MTGHKIPAVFIRGGTSKGAFFKEDDLPASQAERDRIFLRVLGSPDPYQRQLDGMGGGLSSLSKVAIIGRSGRAHADVDYTFVQIAVDRPVVDYGQACGNLSASVGPFAVEEGLLDLPDGEAVVRVYNTNTDKIYHARFEIRDGHAVETGDYAMSGVGGTGAKIRLDYLDPGGANSPGFLPSGNTVDTVEAGGRGAVECSLVDATSPVAFLDAAAMGVAGTERPEALEADTGLMADLDIVRRRAGVVMGLADAPDAVPLSIPKVALVSPPADYTTIGSVTVSADAHDIAVRIVSMERMHRVVTGTGGMCLAAACQVEGSIPHRLARAMEPGQDVRIATPSGVMTVAADAGRDADGAWRVNSVTVYRTQRRLMEGFVVLPRD